MVPIARLEFYFPELQTNQSDDRDGRPYHDLGLTVLGVRSKRRSRCSAVSPGRGDGPHRPIGILLPRTVNELIGRPGRSSLP